MQDVSPVEIASLSYVEGLRQPLTLLITERRLQLRRCPDVKLALLAFAVGVEAGIKAARFRQHFPTNKIEGCFNHAPEIAVFGELPAVEVGPRQQRVVVQHLLEMRDEPVLIDAVAMKAATELVVHAAGGHRPQGVYAHLERGRGMGSRIAAEQHVDQHRLRKLWRATKTAEGRIIVS